MIKPKINKYLLNAGFKKEFQRATQHMIKTG